MKKVIVLILMVLLLVSCSKDGLVGTWIDESSGLEVTFNDDNTCDFNGTDATFKVKDNKITLTVDGNKESMNFKIENTTLTLSYPDLDDFEFILQRVSN